MIWNNLLILVSIALFVFVIVAFLILRKKEPRKKFFVFIFIVAIMFCTYFFKDYILDFLKGIPIVWTLVGPIVSQVEKGNLLGLYCLTALGSLFFISIPSELSMLYYLSLGHNPVWVIIITVLGNLTGLSFDYLFGRIFGEGLIRFFIKNKFDVLKGLFDKIGGGVIVAGNIIPYGTEILALTVGSMKYKFKKYIIYAAIGITIKFCGVFFLKQYFTENLLPKAKEYFSTLIS
jgi:membrane protein DedA with SNARE-associated domain